MIVDTSALVAILRDEPEAAAFAAALVGAGESLVSAANYLEAAIVVDSGRDPVASRRFDKLLTLAGVTIAPVTVEQVRLAREAYRDFGKGSGHPAGLNFGDCFAYALARERNDTLLYKGGDDFSHTDVSPVDVASS
ncbi:type II toxin-antitoxin system VapC family toxin [soil metagenome]